jgi:hypothetical protein
MIEKILSADFIYEGRTHATLFVLIQKLLDKISGLNKKKKVESGEEDIRQH